MSRTLISLSKDRMSIPRSTSPQNNHFREVITTTLCWKWFQQAAFKLQHRHICCVFSLGYLFYCIFVFYIIENWKQEFLKPVSLPRGSLHLHQHGDPISKPWENWKFRILSSIFIFTPRITQEYNFIWDVFITCEDVALPSWNLFLLNLVTAVWWRTFSSSRFQNCDPFLNIWLNFNHWRFLWFLWYRFLSWSFQATWLWKS